VDNAQHILPVTNADIAALLAALKQTTESLQKQNQRLDAQNLRLDALERNQRPRRNNSPPRRQHLSKSPPRQEPVRQRRPALERIEPSSNKRDRTPPPREGRASPTTKKGKTIDRSEQRRRSPQGLALMAKQGASASGVRGSRSPSPPRHGDDSPL
ncbi:hypothetical protein A2U01_0021310, partial [Trifolium medium]|nr:hypothetical protein [Trifolium medium]